MHMNLVDAFINIGLPSDASPNGNAAQGDTTLPQGEPSAGTLDHLHRYYIVSRGRNAQRVSDE